MKKNKNCSELFIGEMQFCACCQECKMLPSCRTQRETAHGIDIANLEPFWVSSYFQEIGEKHFFLLFQIKKRSLKQRKRGRSRNNCFAFNNLKSLLFLFLQNKCFVFIVFFCISSEATKCRACFYLLN
jgi:hypothetical protein